MVSEEELLVEGKEEKFGKLELEEDELVFLETPLDDEDTPLEEVWMLLGSSLGKLALLGAWVLDELPRARESEDTESNLGGKLGPMN